MVLHTVEASNVTVALRHLVANSGSEEAYNFVEGIDSILAQTLVRRICTYCMEWYEVKIQDLNRFGYDQNDPNLLVQIARGKGCEQCRNTGYRGRMGLFEFVTLNAEMAEMVVRRAPLTDLKKAAKANGMKELREDGLIKILQGLTTPEEVERAVPIRT